MPCLDQVWPVVVQAVLEQELRLAWLAKSWTVFVDRNSKDTGGKNGIKPLDALSSPATIVICSFFFYYPTSYSQL